MSFTNWLLDNDIVEEASIRISDCKSAYEAGVMDALKAYTDGRCHKVENN